MATTVDFPACRLQLSRIRREWLSNPSTCQGSGAIPSFFINSTPGGRPGPRTFKFSLMISSDQNARNAKRETQRQLNSRQKADDFAAPFTGLCFFRNCFPALWLHDSLQPPSRTLFLQELFSSPLAARFFAAPFTGLFA